MLPNNERIKFLDSEEIQYKWKIQDVNCYEYNTCSMFPFCNECFYKRSKPISKIAVAYFRGTSHIRELKC